MMSTTKRIGRLLVVLITVLLLSSCSALEEEDPGGIRVTPEILESVSAALASRSEAEQQVATSALASTETAKVKSTETKAAQSQFTESNEPGEPPLETTSAEAVTTTEKETQVVEHTSVTSSVTSEVVYWTEGGTVYHLKKDCSSLRRSVNIIQGSIEQALAAEKERVCKSCS